MFEKQPLQQKWPDANDADSLERSQWPAEAGAGVGWACLFNRQRGIIPRTEVNGGQPLSWAPWSPPPGVQGLCDPLPLSDVPVTSRYLNIDRMAPQALESRRM